MFIGGLIQEILQMLLPSFSFKFSKLDLSL